MLRTTRETGWRFLWLGGGRELAAGWAARGGRPWQAGEGIPELVVWSGELPSPEELAALQAPPAAEAPLLVLAAETTGASWDAPAWRRLRELPNLAAVLVRPVAPPELAAVAEVALAGGRRRGRLSRQVADLRQALWLRKLVGRVQGVLMDRRGVGANQALAWLEREAERRGLPLEDLARDLLAAWGITVPRPWTGDPPA